MPKLDILWEGKLSLDYVKWNNVIQNEYKFSNQYNTNAKSHWIKHLKQYPKDYDGTLLFLDSFNFKNKNLFLDIDLIKFSMATYMLKEGLTLRKGLGVLGVQYLVFSPKLDYILIGQRSLSQSYFPGAINIPGGILEWSDLNTLPKTALTRELLEEVSLSLEPNYFLTAILGGWDNISITFLISVITSESFDFNPSKVIDSDKNEWEGGLKWISVNSLRKMPFDNVLDGLYYFQTKLSK